MGGPFYNESVWIAFLQVPCFTQVTNKHPPQKQLNKYMLMFLVIWPILVCEIGQFSNTLKIKHFDLERFWEVKKNKHA
jgi:hypothetical protein